VRPTILLGFLSVIAAECFAQAHPGVAEILKKVSETYRSAKEYELISTSTGTAVPGRLLMAFRAPNQFRTEGADPNADNADGSFDQMILISDGSSVWLYRPKQKAYAVFKASALVDDARPEVLDDFAMGRFRDAGNLAAQAKFVRDEALEIGGIKVDCYVIMLPVSIPQEGTALFTWWIAKKDNRVLREDHDNSSVVYSTIKLNEPLPDELFKFVPPPDARKIVAN